MFERHIQEEDCPVGNLVLYTPTGQTSDNGHPLSDIENIRLARRIVGSLSVLEQDEEEKLLRVYDIDSNKLTQYFNPSNLRNFGNEEKLIDNLSGGQELTSEGLIREGHDRDNVVLTVPSFMIPNPSNSIIERVRKGRNKKIQIVGLERRILNPTDSLIFQPLDGFVSSEEIKVPTLQIIQPDVYLALSTHRDHTQRRAYIPQ